MKAWKAILAALVIFAAGAVTGALSVRIKSHPTPPPPRGSMPPFGPRSRGDLVTRMQRELDLNPTQREHIEQYLRESQEQTKQLWDSIAPRATEVHRKLRERIRAELTADQQKKYEEVFKPRGGGRSGDSVGRDGRRGKTEERRGSRTNPPTRGGASANPPKQ